MSVHVTIKVNAETLPPGMPEGLGCLKITHEDDKCVFEMIVESNAEAWQIASWIADLTGGTVSTTTTPLEAWRGGKLPP